MRTFWSASAHPALATDWVWGPFDDRTRRRLVVPIGAAHVEIRARAKGVREEGVRELVVAGDDVPRETAPVYLDGPDGDVTTLYAAVACTLTHPAIGMHELKAQLGPEEMEFRALTTLGPPTAPWRPTGAGWGRPWLSALEIAAEAAAGCSSGPDVLQALVKVVQRGFRTKDKREENRPSLKPRYSAGTSQGGYLVYLTEALRDDVLRTDEEVLWSCVDFASCVCLLANILGVPARLARVKAPAGGAFKTEPLRGVGRLTEEAFELVQHFVVVLGGRVWDPSFVGVAVGLDWDAYLTRFAAGRAICDERDLSPRWSLNVFPEPPAPTTGPAPLVAPPPDLGLLAETPLGGDGSTAFELVSADARTLVWVDFARSTEVQDATWLKSEFPDVTAPQGEYRSPLGTHYVTYTGTHRVRLRVQGAPNDRLVDAVRAWAWPVAQALPM